MFTPPTRGEKITWATYYSLIFLQGIAVLVIPPQTIEGPLSTPLTFAWGIFLTVAVIPAIASINGRFKWEYTTLPLVIAGMGIYVLALWSLVPATPTRAAQALAITALTVGIARRWFDRRRMVKADKQRANRRRDGPKG